MTPLQRRFVLPVSPTLECPSMLRLWSSEDRLGFDLREREHVASCDWCQRVIASAFHDACPSIGALRAYTEDPHGHLERGAMECHLEQHRCRACRTLLASEVFRRCLTFHRRHAAAGQVIPSAAIGSRAAILARVPARAAAGSPRLHGERTRGERLELESWLNDDGHVVARAFSKDAGLAGSRVLFALFTPDATMTSAARLSMRGQSYVAEAVFELAAGSASEYLVEAIVQRPGP